MLTHVTVSMFIYISAHTHSLGRQRKKGDGKVGETEGQRLTEYALKY